MDPMRVVLIVAVLTAVIGRVGVRYWVIRRYRTGRITARKAGALVFVLTVVPYIFIFTYVLVRDPGAWWVVLLLFVASWPVIALPWIMVSTRLPARSRPSCCCRSAWLWPGSRRETATTARHGST